MILKIGIADDDWYVLAPNGLHRLGPMHGVAITQLAAVLRRNWDADLRADPEMFHRGNPFGKAECRQSLAWNREPNWNLLQEMLRRPPSQCLSCYRHSAWWNGRVPQCQYCTVTIEHGKVHNILYDPTIFEQQFDERPNTLHATPIEPGMVGYVGDDAMKPRKPRVDRSHDEEIPFCSCQGPHVPGRLDCGGPR
jgi:hypothetical protein